MDPLSWNLGPTKTLQRMKKNAGSNAWHAEERQCDKEGIKGQAKTDRCGAKSDAAKATITWECLPAGPQLQALDVD